MDNKKMSVPLIVLSTLFFQLTARAGPLFHVCTINEKFTANSQYEKNLKILLHDLYYRTPVTGYEYEFVTGTNNDSVYRSALCRGDVSSADCRTCIFKATEGIHQICPDNVGANIWYEHCSLENSNLNSFGNPLSTGYYSKSHYDANIPVSHSSLSQIKGLLNILSHEASA
ncbi:hypothetical protein ACH5RR_016175 [Cinchona calisaya]|uniref:Gnk2-homologous domain-containing protein n=1 Tax=Cinchona calisaya TaxID=153742 RepID=A0ABD2ZV92_9GENT